MPAAPAPSSSSFLVVLPFLAWRLGPAGPWPAYQAGRRKYASAPDTTKKSSDLPWMLASVGLGVPAAFYLLQSSPTKVASHNHHGETRMTERKEAEIPPERETVGPDVKPSEVDEPAGRKAPSGANTISAKQEGLDSSDTDNPYVAEPGKSVKGEGETDSVKLKGTVDPARPQR
ncbi:hypothetical protein KXV22_003313 [Aspergillus fumigatus]|nr:hypothetical protein KXX06_007275 [Aspergillus fumigatus]KAH2107151.1 hypothetical protein KXW75_008366 [Aspergillus fumigatus]KAH2542970.1 hypothetical protein KXW97_003093 [Aspergillus fumigatus]KAH3570784.1 hypothetical protein KXV22_003313 [Aspergillus fumigatus]